MKIQEKHFKESEGELKERKKERKKERTKERKFSGIIHKITLTKIHPISWFDIVLVFDHFVAAVRFVAAVCFVVVGL